MHSKTQTYYKLQDYSFTSPNIPPSTKRSSFTEKNNVSKIIKDPLKLQVYSILLNQQSVNLKQHYSNYKPASLEREGEDNKLIENIFGGVNNNVKTNVEDADIIFGESFNAISTKVNFATSNVSNSNFEEFKTLRQDTATFNQLMKLRYESYRRNFEPTTHESDHNIKDPDLVLHNDNDKFILNKNSYESQRVIRASIKTEDEESDKDCIAVDVVEPQITATVTKRVFVGLYSINRPQIKYNRDTGSTYTSSIKSTLTYGRASNITQQSTTRRIKIMHSASFGHT